MRAISVIALFFSVLNKQASCFENIYHYTCNSTRLSCSKHVISDDVANPLSLPQCEQLCVGSAGVWPQPSDITISTNYAEVDSSKISFFGLNESFASSSLLEAATNIFVQQLPTPIASKNPRDSIPFNINIQMDNPNLVRLDLNTIENYTITVNNDCSTGILARISADNFFGIRHGLETLNQLVILDDIRNILVLPCGVQVTDGPAYKWRGVLLDTSRNYATLDTIKATLNAMGAAKLNVFHWHLTDTHSFPWVSESRPELSKYGAYSPEKTYTNEVVQEVISYGLIRGVRVVPEFDAPAHVGEGWLNTNLVTCFNWQPWESYCYEPPCGQFDPTKDELYDYLSDIYKDLINQFNPDVIHLGGDEVNFDCWRNSPEVVAWMTAQGWGQTDADFVKLWAYFQTKALERLDQQTSETLPVVLWTSTLTQASDVTEILPTDRYIIQVWTTKYDTQINEILEKGYKIVLSNYDALYMDCGFGEWSGDGVNWCSPYISWTSVYENKPSAFILQHTDQVLGAEATLFSETADSYSVDTKLWPRASAMAEVLWSAPTIFNPWRDAANRFLVHRERLVRLGIKADAVMPEWCKQNQDNCILTW